MFITQLNQLKNLVAMGKSITEISKTMKLSKYEVKFALDKNNLKSDQANNEFNLNLIRAYISEKDEFTAQEIAAFYNLNVKQVESLLKTISNIKMKETKKVEAKLKGNSYTQKDDDFILECKRKGLSNKYIADNLNPKRNWNAVSVRYNELRKKLPQDQLPPLLGKFNLKKVKTTLTLDDKLKIATLWSHGLSKKNIAKDLNISLTDLENQWDDIAGLGKANDEFTAWVEDLFKQGFTKEQILSKNSLLDKDRFNKIWDELFNDPKLKIESVKRKTSWSGIEDKTILQLNKEGKTHEEIAKEVGRTKFAVTNRLWRLNNCTIPVKIPKIKKCEPKLEISNAQEYSKDYKGNDFDDSPKVETTSSTFKATIPKSEFQKGMESLWSRKSSTSKDQTLEMFKEALESEVKDQTIVFIIKK